MDAQGEWVWKRIKHANLATESLPSDTFYLIFRNYMQLSSNRSCYLLLPY